MQSEPFVIERTCNAPVVKVWEAITDKDQMRQWYFDIADFKPETGFEFTFSGQGRKGEKYIHLCRITEVIREKKLSYTWTYEGLSGESLVAFELSADGDKTHIKLTHSGIESFASNGPDFAKESFAEGWTTIIGNSLRDFTEKK